MRQHLRVFAAAWKGRGRLRPCSEQAPEQAFLPGALELLDRPPSPIGRGIVWAIVALVVLAVAWAAVSEVEVVAVARGRIVPGGMSKLIQPLEMGMVRAIEVQEGQRVAKGDLLIALDTADDEAQARIVEQEIDGLRSDRARLSALMADIDNPQDRLSARDAPAGLPTDPQNIQARLYRRQRGLLRERLGVLESRASQQRAELDATEARVEKLAGILPLVTRRAEKLAPLSSRKMVPEQQYLELEQRRIEVRQELAVERSNLIRASAALMETGREREALLSSTGSHWLEQIGELEHRLDTLAQERIRLRERIGRGRLHAPVSGVVQELSVHTLGGVVRPAERLMRIVPEQGGLEVEALLANKDVGFVTVGQRADIKVDTYPFTRHGTLAARVVTLSGDAVEHESLGLAYAMRLQLVDYRVRAGGQWADLSPGMTVTVEVTTGRRRLIDYFLSPLMRYADESVRER